MDSKTHFPINSVCRVLVLGVVLLAPTGAARAQTPAGVPAEVDADAAVVLGQAAAEDVFGPLVWVDITPYLDPEMNVSVYAIEYARRDSGDAVAVIASARRDDIPVIMMWSGYPKHSDPNLLAAVRRSIEETLGVVVSEPDAVLWLDIHEVWAQFPETDPETGEAVLCNFYTRQIASLEELQRKWLNRQENLLLRTEAPPSGLQALAVDPDATARQLRLIRARTQAEYVDAQWAAADSFLARQATGEHTIVQQAPAFYTCYIKDVPNLDQQIVWDGRNWDGDCTVVPAMDVLLFWDTRGYGRLVDGSDLNAVHRDLRQAMNFADGEGATDADAVTGLRDFINQTSYGNQYSFDVDLVYEAPYGTLSFSDLRSEIDSGRPALVAVGNYTDDPANSTDSAYGNHWMCVVGYYQGKRFSGSLSSQWVIVHDNWGGGAAANPYLIDDEPYIDWGRATDGIMRVKPGPSGTAVTYPSASGVSWRAGETQLITWTGFTGSSVKIELYKGSSWNRTITASTANDGLFSWSIPNSQANGSDFKIKITSTSNSSQYDYSDNAIAISGGARVLTPSASGITWRRGNLYTITWTGFTGSSVRIGLYKGSSLNRTIALAASNTGRFYWLIPSTQTGGSDFKIKITSNSNSSQYDYSDNPFAISSSTPRVTSPSAAGTTWSRGSLYVIGWSGFTGPSVKIELYKGSSLNRTVSSSTNNDGMFLWSVPTAQTTGSDFKIKITSTSSSFQYDYSDNPFTISAGPQVTSPSASGITWARGGFCSIAWSGFTGSSVKIELYKGSSLNRTISSSANNSGLYLWSVPSTQTTGSDFKIKITSTSNSFQYDYSDNPFTISAGASRVTSPSVSGITWTRGKLYVISWSGFTSSSVKIELYKGWSLNRTISSSTGNDGTFYWLVPSTQTIGSDFRVKITSTSNSSQYDYSDNYFAISLGS